MSGSEDTGEDELNSNQLPIEELEEIEEICREVIEKFPQYARLYYHQGSTALGFLAGQVMKESGGTCNPKLVHQTLKRMLEEKTNEQESDS